MSDPIKQDAQLLQELPESEQESVAGGFAMDMFDSFSSSKQISALSARLNIIIHQMVGPIHKELGISFPNSLWHLARPGSVEVELDLVALGGWAVFSTSSEAGEIRVLQKLLRRTPLSMQQTQTFGH